MSPNPAIGTVVLRYNGKDASTFRVQLVNQYGQVNSRNWLMNGTALALDLSGVHAGTYLLLIIDKKTGDVVQRQLVKL